MLHRIFLLAALAMSAGAAVSGQTTQGPDADKVAGFIEKLGSANFAERERAKVELEKMGAPALDALRKAAQSDDLETSRRAGELVRKIEEKSVNANLLAPKKIHLKLQDASVAEALAELEKQSGYHIQIATQVDQTALKNRKVTLDTGAVTFWQAFDQLCNKAGLVEQEAMPTPRPQFDRPAIRGIRIQPQPLPINPIQNQVLPAPALPIQPQALPINPIQKQILPVLPLQRQALPLPGVLPVVPPNANGAAPQLQAILPVVPVQPGAKNIALPVQVQAIQIIQAVQAAQAKAAIAAPIQINPGLRPNQAQAGLFVTDGTPKSVPTSYSGAVRVRLLPASAEQRNSAKPGEMVFVLDVDAEPRLQNFTLAATPQIEKAIDDQGQTLQVAMDEQQGAANIGNPNINPAILQRLVIAQNGYQQIRQQALVRFKAGEKPAKSIKELSGAVSAQALTATEPVVVVKDILKAAGQTEKANGFSMQINSVEKQPNGDVKIEVSLEGAPGQNVPGVQVFPGGGIQIQGAQIQINGNVVIGGNIGGAGNSTSLPTLVDADGKSFRLTNTPGRRLNINNGRIISQVTLVFSPGPGQGEADRLVLNGQRTATFQVPFSFKDVPVE